MGRRKDFRGISSSAVAVAVGTSGEGFVAHVGDCRACLVHDGAALLVTTDHTLATAIERGEIKLEEEVPAADDIVLRVAVGYGRGVAMAGTVREAGPDQ